MCKTSDKCINMHVIFLVCSLFLLYQSQETHLVIHISVYMNIRASRFMMVSLEVYNDFSDFQIFQINITKLMVQKSHCLVQCFYDY